LQVLTAYSKCECKITCNKWKPLDMGTEWKRKESRSVPVFNKLPNRSPFLTSRVFTRNVPMYTSATDSLSFSLNSHSIYSICHITIITGLLLCQDAISVKLHYSLLSTPFAHITIRTGLLLCQDVLSVKLHYYTRTLSIITAHKHSRFEITHCLYLKTKEDCFRNLLSVCVL
jgi:hypothetical protein